MIFNKEKTMVGQDYIVRQQRLNRRYKLKNKLHGVAYKIVEILMVAVWAIGLVTILFVVAGGSS